MSYKVGILGMGTVGTGVAKILLDPVGRHAILQSVEIKRVGVRSLNKDRGIILDPSIFTDDLEAVVTDPNIDVVIELIGGIEPARSLILQAIAQGKHIVTANKAVLARYGDEIFTAATAKGVYVMLEAAVGGGIPIIQTLKQALGANKITAVTGIINGTTNYILSRMSANPHESFAEILADAQALGYAEADPTADVDGYDATDKIAILASLAFGDRIKLEQIYREGIRHVTSTDVARAAELGYVIKLLAIARNHEGLEIRVHPTLVPKDHPLASINGVTNAITVAGDPIGEVVLSGAGAGMGATASAVVADLINIVAAIQVQPQRPNQLMGCSHHHYATVKPITVSTSQYYLRLLAYDHAGVIGDLGNCFGKYEVNLETILQKHHHQGLAEIIVVTKVVSELNLQTALTEIRSLAALHSIPTVLRLLA
ncbi:homoserine dehydrogenase [Synechococcus sp. PCC 7502]|uniref:homoserine dehydrogenase n=1 Tax=Synechococcus sp. PCC 7502 TaxID=1173263 RepID=UPI00059CC0A3|nr:homoserine dehydrogenase [Synechococcus sp. PCC 7502]